MLYFLIVWSILLPVCLSIGLFILNFCHADEFSRQGDRLIISVWLGIVVLCVSCISCALVLPLSPGVGGLIALGWVLISASSGKTRQDLYQFYTLISLKILVQGAAIAIAVAAFTTQQIIWFDTGLYHLGSIHWMAEFGSVPGLGLINSKFGFTSSWFAFSAPLIFDWSGDNIGAVSNGYLGYITLLCGFIGLHQSLTEKSKFSNYFIAIFSLLIMTIYVMDNVNGNSLISFSPDIPVALLIGIFAWSILLIAAFPSSQQKNFGLDSKIIPLLLASAAVSIKLTAFPFLSVAVLFYLGNKKFQFNRLMLSIILSLLLLLPNALFGTKTSGCPLYPAQIMCLDLPWTVSKETIEAEIKAITGMRTVSPNNNPLFALIQKRYAWLKKSIKIQFTALIYIISLSLGILIILKQKQSSQPGEKWIILLGIIGMTFIMTSIPLIRFGLGYFLSIPSLFIAKNCFLLKTQSHLLALKKADKLVKQLTLPLVIGILLIGGGGELNNRWLLPAKLPQVKLIKAHVNDIEYTYPAAWINRCWAAKLPCAPLPIRYDIHLRNALQGLKSGFEFSQ